MATRLFLTLLALLTGLSVQQAPARALAAVEGRAGIEAVSEPRVVPNAPHRAVMGAAAVTDWNAAAPRPASDPAIIEAHAPVLPGIDRARE